MKIKGIAFKTFIFTATLITLVSAVTLGVLYYVMPEYYRASKETQMQMNLATLAVHLQEVEDADAARGMLIAFCMDNNASILTYETENEIATEFSSPFLSYQASGDLTQFVSIEPIRVTAGRAIADPAAGHTIQINMALASPLFEEDTPWGYERQNTTETLPTQAAWVGIEDGGDAGMAHSVDAISLTMTNTLHDSIYIKQNVDGVFAHSLVASAPLQPIGEAKGVILSLLPYILLMNVVIAVAAAYFYSRMITKPILSISSAAEQMRGLAPGAESKVESNDELGALSGNLNTLYSTLCTHIEFLQEETKRVTAMEQSKTHFLRAAGHELKTPIAALNGIVEGMLDDVGVYKDKTKYLKESKGLIRNLTMTVNEILEATRHDEINPNEEAPCAVNINRMVQKVFRNQSVLMQKNGLQVDFTGLHDFSGIVTCERAMRTALSNIVCNAVKYADTASVIRVWAENSKLVIENQCPTIPEEHLARLFDPFYSVNYSRDKSKSGTGLGLYIVKKNLDALGFAYAVSNTETGVAFSIDMDAAQ